MTGVMRDQVNNHNRVDEMKIDKKIETVLDVWPIHMSEVVGDHEQDAKRAAHPNHEAEHQRQSDQQMAPLHQKVGVGQHGRRGKMSKEVVEGHNVMNKMEQPAR